MWFTIVLYVLFFLVVGLTITTAVLNRKEVKEMTLEKFKEKFNALVAKKDGAGLSVFMKRNFVFILTHANEVEPFIKEVCGRATVDDNENKEV